MASYSATVLLNYAGLSAPLHLFSGQLVGGGGGAGFNKLPEWYLVTALVNA